MLETTIFWLALSVGSTRSFVNIGDNYGIPLAYVYKHAADHQVTYHEALKSIKAEHAAKPRAN
jgi:hypothetical protein